MTQTEPLDPESPLGMLRNVLPHRSLGLKLILVCGLALLMAIPALFIWGIVSERSRGQEQAIISVAEGVGNRQSVLGPVLSVPYEITPNPARPNVKTYGVAVVYAETGKANATVKVEERHRGIYLVPVFDAEMDFTAEFDTEALRRTLPSNAVPTWPEARIVTGVSDTRGIRQAGNVTINGKAVALEPVTAGSGDPNNRHFAPMAAVTLAGAKVPEFETLTGRVKVASSLRLSGADQLSFGPFAKDTSVSLDSDWSDPSFTGGVLPLDHNAGETGRLKANWNVSYLARDIEGAGINLDLGRVTMNGHRDMGVRFMREANPYQSVERALKYAAMFIGLVFLTYFLLEILSGARAHPAQYILVGLAQAIFYLLLLAFAEQQGFDIAFFIAAVMTVTLTSLYAASVFRSWAYGARAFAVLTGIYALIYTLMRLEDFALLAGALASFAAIALTMYVTRNIDWYGGRDRPAA